MKVFKHMTAFVLALVMAAALAVTAYAATVTVKYRVYVYSDEITFRQYDYSQSTTPSITNLTISATSSLGSGSAGYPKFCVGFFNLSPISTERLLPTFLWDFCFKPRFRVSDFFQLLCGISSK